MAQLVSLASDARSLQARKNQAGSFIPRATPYARFDACHETCSDGCHCGTARSCRYAYDRKTLRAPCPELRCGHDPRTFPHTRNYRGKLCDAHAKGKLKVISGPWSQPVSTPQAPVCLVDDALR